MWPDGHEPALRGVPNGPEKPSPGAAATASSPRFRPGNASPAESHPVTDSPEGTGSAQPAEAVAGQDLARGKPSTDTGGLPWAGRTLPVGEFSGDDGTADPALAALLATDAPDLVHVMAALSAARVLTAVVALPGVAESTGPAAQSGSPELTQADEATESSATSGSGGTEMALVTLTGPDGRVALPVFSAAETLRRWRPEARPVPVAAARAALSAVAQGCEVLVLDPAGPVTLVLARPALWALAQGRPWVPAISDPQVRAELARLAPEGTSIGQLTAPAEVELRVTLVLPEGLTPEQVRSRPEEFAAALSASELIRERVEGLTVAVSSGIAGN